MHGKEGELQNIKQEKNNVKLTKNYQCLILKKLRVWNKAQTFHLNQSLPTNFDTFNEVEKMKWYKKWIKYKAIDPLHAIKALLYFLESAEELKLTRCGL